MLEDTDEEHLQDFIEVMGVEISMRSARVFCRSMEKIHTRKAPATKSANKKVGVEMDADMISKFR